MDNRLPAGLRGRVIFGKGLRMSDLISREAVIKALENCYCGGEDSCGEPWIYKDHVIKAVEQLPPAQLGTNLAEVGTDCISRQAAIDAIGEKSDEIYKTKQRGATYPHDDFFQGMAYAENVVKQLPTIQPEPHWIPVTERLPEYGMAVLTYNRDEEFEINHIIDDEDGEWFYNGAVAWMPLPEPYKGVTE